MDNINDKIISIKKAQEIAEKSFYEVLNFIKEGVTEKEIEEFLTKQLIKNGSDKGNFGICCASGKNSAFPHCVATNSNVKSGDTILLDFGAIYNGYYCDMTRTFAYKTPTDEFLKAYDVVKKANEKSIENLKIGLKCKELHMLAFDLIDSQGLGKYFIHGLGHGVGKNIHILPKISKSSDDILQKGDIITIEPGVYIPNKFGIRIEDLLLIDEKVENLTSVRKELIIL